MTSVAFIVKLNLSDISVPSLEAVANNIGHALLDDGMDVLDVTPYARPSLTVGNLMQQPEPQQDFGVGLQGLGGL